MVSPCAWACQALLLSLCSCPGDSWGGRVDWRPDVAGESGYVCGMSLMVSLLAWASRPLMLSCGSCHALTGQPDSRPDAAGGSACVWGMATTMSPFAWACQPLTLSCGSCHMDSLSEPLDSWPNLAGKSGFACAQALHVWNGPCPQGH